MSNNRKPSLGFSYSPARAVLLATPVAVTEEHTPHFADEFDIEVDSETDTAKVYLAEVDAASGIRRIKRVSNSIPLSMLADLVRQRPADPSEMDA